MKNAVLKRIGEIEQKVVDLPMKNIRKLVSKMTTEELRECVNDSITDKRFQEIVKGAACR